MRPDDGVWSDTLIHTENLGSDTYHYLDMGTEEPVAVRLAGEDPYRPGDTVRVSPPTLDRRRTEYT